MAATTQDHYAALEVPRTADGDTIKTAYRKLARKYHPDRNPNDEQAAERFHAVREAFDVLSDPHKRRFYDLSSGLASSRPYGNDFASQFKRSASEVHFNTRYGQPAQQHPHAQQFTTPKRSASFHKFHTTNPSYSGPAGMGSSRTDPEDVFFSPGGQPPPPQNMPGSAPGHYGYPHGHSHPHHHHHHHQHGQQGGYYSNSSPGGARRNSGARPQQPLAPIIRPLPCSLEDLFHGFQKKLKVTRQVEQTPGVFKTETVVLTVDGKPGCTPGTQISFAGAGDVLLHRSPQDIILVVEEKQHDRFTREGYNLRLDCNVPLLRALLGYTIAVEAIDGRQLVLPVSRIVPNMVVTVAGAGMPKPTGSRGSLLIRLDIDYPSGQGPDAGFTPATDGPNDCTIIPVACEGCGKQFCEMDNTESACWYHPGQKRGVDKLSVFSRSDQIHVAQERRLWSCCNGPADSRGCTCRGPHTATSESWAQLRATAAANGLCAAARAGSVMDCARFLVRSPPPAVVEQAAKIAFAHGHWMVLVLLSRLGLSENSLGGQHLVPTVVTLIKQDKEFAKNLGQVLLQSELVQMLCSCNGALEALFFEVCMRTNSKLALQMLVHPEIGASKCNVSSHVEACSHLLMQCATDGNSECARVLLLSGVPVDVEVDGHTALLEAVEHKQEAMVSLLLNNGAFSQAGWAIFRAVELRAVDITAQLIEAGAELDWCEPVMKRTALHQACVNNDPNMVELLVSNGARISLRDTDGKRAVDIAMDRNYSTCTSQLQSALLEEALRSMSGLTVVRVINDHLTRSRSRSPGVSAATAKAAELEPNIEELIASGVFPAGDATTEFLSQPPSPSHGAPDDDSSSTGSSGSGGSNTNANTNSNGPVGGRVRLLRRKSSPTPPVNPLVTEQADLRPALTVLEDSLRMLCEFSDGIAMPCDALEDSGARVIGNALKAYANWRRAQQTPEEHESATKAVTALITAGVTVKALLQERLSWIDEQLQAEEQNAKQ